MRRTMPAQANRPPRPRSGGSLLFAAFARFRGRRAGSSVESSSAEGLRLTLGRGRSSSLLLRIAEGAKATWHLGQRIFLPGAIDTVTRSVALHSGQTKLVRGMIAP